MATLSELVEIVAAVEGIDLATVRLIARNLREAGLIATRGRGLSAAKMTLADAANLLIAVNATDKVREAAQTVHTYRRLEAYGRWTGRRFRFGDALEQLIQAASNKALPEQYVFDPVPPLVAEYFAKGEAEVVVVFHRPVPNGQIGIATSEHERVWLGESAPYSSDKARKKYFKNQTSIGYEFLWPGSEEELKRGDRHDRTTIRFPTIRAVGKLLPIDDISTPPAPCRSERNR